MSLPAFKIALFGLPKNIVVLAQNFDRFLVSWPRNDRGPLTFGIHDGIPDKRARMIPLGVLHGIGLGLSIVIFYKLDFLAKVPHLDLSKVLYLDKMASSQPLFGGKMAARALFSPGKVGK